MTDQLPQLVEVAKLVPYGANARTHSEAQIEQIKESFRAFGFVGVLAYDDKGLAAGHGRQTALLEMWEAGEVVMGPGKREPLPEGMAPGVDITGLSPEERRAFIIADNKLAMNAGWDEDLLRQELAALDGLDFDMPVMGFDSKELERLFNAPADDAGQGSKSGSMAAEFLIPPFTILNAREGWWQDRKRQWIGLGIQSEVGRGENLLKMSDTMLEPDPVKRAAMIADRERREASGESVYLKGAAKVEITTDPYRARQKNGKRRGATFGQDFLEGEGTNVGLTHLRQSTGAKQNPIGGPRPGGGGGGAWLKRREGGFKHSEYDGKDAKATQTQDWVQRKIEAGEIEGGMAAGQTGTSIFDPVLCELAYRWFSPKGGVVLDPFAGGSVRGIVCAALGRRYVGIDLRQEQIEANRAQWPAVADRLGAPAPAAEPEWHVGDSLKVIPDLAVEADMIFSCPPYGDLEVYSDDPDDISTLAQAEFDAAYAKIIGAAVAKLKDDRFACFVVGDYRDKRGIYANFVSKTIAAFEAAGAPLYNEAILVTSVGSLPIRAAKQFRTSRKLGKTHQNVLIFVKGDPRKATQALGPVDVSAALADVEPDDDE